MFDYKITLIFALVTFYNICISWLQVQNLLQQMQDKFQGMSDQIIGRNILSNSVLCD